MQGQNGIVGNFAIGGSQNISHGHVHGSVSPMPPP